MQKQLHHISVNNIGHFFLTKKFKIWRIIRMRIKQKHLSHIISCSLIWKRFLFFSYILYSFAKSNYFRFTTNTFGFFFEVHGDHHRKQRPWPSNIRFSKLFKNLFFFKITNCVTVLKYFCFSLKSSVDLACLWKELPEILN